MTNEVVQIWEALGCVPEDPRPWRESGPIIRPALRSNGEPVAKLTMRDYDCLDPDTGVSYIRLTLPDGSEVSAHGDDVTGCYVRVFGMDESYVRDMFARLEAALPAFLAAIWRPAQLRETA